MTRTYELCENALEMLTPQPRTPNHHEIPAMVNLGLARRDKHDIILRLCMGFIVDLGQKLNCNPKFAIRKAALGIALYKYALKYSPKNSNYFNRDRIITSDCASGPTGQGIDHAVSMAIAMKNLAALYNKPGFEVIENMTWCVVDDPCLQQGVSLEAISVAGHWNLNNLCIIYDSNSIPCNGVADAESIKHVETTMRETGWNVIEIPDGASNITAITNALFSARTSDKPTFIKIHTSMRFGSFEAADASQNVGLRADEVSNIKTSLGLNPDEIFYMPHEVYDFFADVRSCGGMHEAEWQASLDKYERHHPFLADQLRFLVAAKTLNNRLECLPEQSPSGIEVTELRDSKGLLSIGHLTPEVQIPTSEGHQAHIAPQERIRPRKGKRARHQPTILPAPYPDVSNNLHIRPCDSEEAAGAFLVAIQSDDRTTIISLPQQSPAQFPQYSSREGVILGAYVFAEPDGGDSDVTLIGVGSDMSCTMETRTILSDVYGLKSRVVSFPCQRLFEQQSPEYKQSVLRPRRGRPTVVIVAQGTNGWERYADVVVLIARSGKGAVPTPLDQGFNPQQMEIAHKIRRLVKSFRRYR
ncbi:hypothetical protein G7Z17_g2444 [Cylindrodendrum hubeiense]|uniref:Transketolase n=1 Tax=Cylindrodendrum hubeiense TaxID=595255 RepID=A0A9P5HCU5_9HYPO|nr:hypothetical protein G7Z17_g2444 [Cylindrodendrum hubeiense]